MHVGLDLKVERIRARVTATELAVRMGVSRQRVSQLEAADDVTPAMAQRYRDALLQLAAPLQNQGKAAASDHAHTSQEPLIPAEAMA